MTKICAAIEEGLTRKAAANMVGITYKSLRAWELEKSDFCEALELAEGRAEARFQRILNQAATGWVEVEVVEEEIDRGTTRRVRRTRKFMPQYAALWLRTRRPQDHHPDRVLTEEEGPRSGEPKLADLTSSIRPASF